MISFLISPLLICSCSLIPEVFGVKVTLVALSEFPMLKKLGVDLRVKSSSTSSNSTPW